MSLDGTLKCSSIADIFLLLKSSDFIAHDLSHAYEDCISDSTASDEASDNHGITARPQNFDLILRKWYDLHPSMEFRCFVRNNHLIGMYLRDSVKICILISNSFLAITQRDYLNYYSFLVESRDEIEDSIKEFFESKIKNKFSSDSCMCSCYFYQDFLLNVVYY